MRVLWATTFSADLYAVSGHALVRSFLDTGTPGTLAAYTEGEVALPAAPAVAAHRLDGDPFLARFLAANRDVIPATLGGLVAAPECRCRGGPHGVHSRRHLLPCVGYWFCKNAFRWLRKVHAARLAAEAYAADHDLLVWVDSDALFRKRVPPEAVASWFTGGLGCAYVKGGRDAVETGVVAYHLRQGGRAVLDALFDRYASGRFRRDRRWDDCVQLERALAKAVRAGVKVADLARGLGPRNTVLHLSPLGEYLDHQKGLHNRTKTIT